MNLTPDLLVLGAGPAGMEAAIAASASGLSVVLVDQAPLAGGQVYRPLPVGYQASDSLKADPDFAVGEALRARLARSAVEVAYGQTIWRAEMSATKEFEIEAYNRANVQTFWKPKAVVAATGALERFVPFEGWTRPGVMGLAAATILLKSQQMLPGHRTVVAGCGPLLAAVAASILKNGGQVAAIVDLASQGDWLSALPALATRPDQLMRGFKWWRMIRAAGVPILHRHTVIRAEGGDEALARITVAPCTEGGAPIPGAQTQTFEADALAIGHGLIPSNDVTRSLRAKHTYVRGDGGWIADHDAGFRTSVPQLYVCGDGAGLRGAAPAALQGRIAGLTAARDQGRLDQTAYARDTATLTAQLAKAETFGKAMAKLMAPRPDMVSALPKEQVVCRCEEIRRAEIEEAVDVGAVHLNQIKAWTRVGQGPCQGRVCGETIATITAEKMHGGTNVDAMTKVGLWTSRSPIRPVPMKAIVGDYAYTDIVWNGNKLVMDDEGRPLTKAG